MANIDPQEKPKKSAKAPREKSTLESAAETIGATLGAIAVSTGIAHPPVAKPGKFVKKNKSRLPRKEKKHARKTTTS